MGTIIAVMVAITVVIVLVVIGVSFLLDTNVKYYEVLDINEKVDLNNGVYYNIETVEDGNYIAFERKCNAGVRLEFDSSRSDKQVIEVERYNMLKDKSGMQKIKRITLVRPVRNMMNFEG